MLKALAKELPGIYLRFVTSRNVRQPTAAEAFVSETHGMAGMRRQDFESREEKPVGARTILMIASDVLSNLNVLSNRSAQPPPGAMISHESARRKN